MTATAPALATPPHRLATPYSLALIGCFVRLSPFVVPPLGFAGRIGLQCKVSSPRLRAPTSVLGAAAAGWRGQRELRRPEWLPCVTASMSLEV